MKKMAILFFALGFLSCALIIYGFNYSNIEVPFGTGLSIRSNTSAPSNWIEDKDIVVFEDMIMLKIPNATISSYANSGSMKPFFDEEANGIRIVPESAEQIEVGDIISYRFEGMLVVHRVIEKGFDEKGVYFITKGDNNIINDGKVRFEDIEYVTVGIIF